MFTCERESMSLRAKSAFHKRQRNKGLELESKRALDWGLPLPILPEAKQGSQ